VTTERSDGHGGDPRPKKGWRAQLGNLAIGIALGMGVTLVSGTFGYRGAAAVAAVGGILLGAHQLRQFPDKSPLVVGASYAASILALVCAVMAVIVPSSWSGYAVLGAVLFAVAATVIPLDRYRAVRTLGGIATIGMGVSLIGGSIGIMQSFVGDPLMLIGLVLLFVAGLFGAIIGSVVATIGVGISLIGAGIALLLPRDMLLGVAGVGLGVSLIGGGIALLPFLNISTFPAWLIAAGAVAAIGAGVAFPLVRGTLIGVASVGLGLELVGLGVLGLNAGRKFGDSSVVLETWLIAAGAVAIAAGIIFLLARGRLVGIAGIGLGLSLITEGVAAQLFQFTILAVWLIAAGAVAIGAGIAFLLARGRLVDIAWIGLGLSLISGGVAALIAQNTLLLFEIILGVRLTGALTAAVAIGAWVAIGTGAAAIGAGVALPLARGTLTGIAGICLGVSLIGAGIAIELVASSLIPAWLIAVGVMLLVFGVARLRDRWYVLGGAAAIGFGILLAVPGVDFLLGGELLVGVGALGAGVALAAVGTGVIVHPSQTELRGWLSNKWVAWTRAPGGPREDNGDETI